MRVFRFMATSPLIKDSVHRPVKLTALSGHFDFALPRTSELSFDIDYGGLVVKPAPG